MGPGVSFFNFWLFIAAIGTTKPDASLHIYGLHHKSKNEYVLCTNQSFGWVRFNSMVLEKVELHHMCKSLQWRLHYMYVWCLWNWWIYKLNTTNTNFRTNASIILNQCHLVVKYASGTIWWPNLQLMQVVPCGSKFSHGVNSWVRCASGNVSNNSFPQFQKRFLLSSRYASISPALYFFVKQVSVWMGWEGIFRILEQCIAMCLI